MIKYIFFDVAGTLLHKPSLFGKIQLVLSNHNYKIHLNEIKFKHKLLSEVIDFPDRTNGEFYKKFNSELLFLLGIVPEESLLNEIYEACSYLPWQKFEDTSVIEELNIPKGIISNFNTTLKSKLDDFFGPIFQDVFVSEELGVSKPDKQFYEKVIDIVDFMPNEILYIGDSMNLDVAPAKSLGIKVLLIDRDDFYINSEFKIKDLHEISNYIL